ncbi:hypothetical protein [Nonomuraea zeae]|uniref:Uncharacterized protein n=1 Tax=Nonomuraea zeae TaxID=1642303 RepID=A0A5S4G4R6_9ACTN|nr:hypothetical protein [Nonomuraea zeae]TMR28007.1 hypothetical protein ETD85_37240 [Nonomuraea zeae]
MPAEFSAGRWERDYRRMAGTAFRRVPFYRDQWVAAGRELDEPECVPSAELAGQLHRLCPFARPFDASQEPSAWIGDGLDLREALALAGAPRRAPVLEVRSAVLDRRRLGWGGPRYGVLLAPEAKVVDEGRRRALDSAALGLAAEAGQAVLVGERPALDALLPELAGVRITTVERMTADQAVRRTATRKRTTAGTTTSAAQGKGATAGAALGEGATAEEVVPGLRVVHDPHLGYFAATVPACGGTHVLWRRFHARQAGGALAVTALRRTRPVLAGVIPDGGASLTLATCPEHGTPIVATH